MRSESLCRICVMHKSDFELPICLPHLTISIPSHSRTPFSFFPFFCSFSFLFVFIVLFGFVLSWFFSVCTPLFSLFLHSLQHKRKEKHYAQGDEKKYIMRTHTHARAQARTANHVYIPYYKLRLLRSLFYAFIVLQIL